MGHENTPTFAFFAFLMMPDCSKRLHSGDIPEGSRENTIPLTTSLSSNPPPMILTTRTLSTLNAIGFFGMTDNTALATSLLRNSSFPYCFDAIVVLIAFAISSSDLISATLSTARSTFQPRLSTGTLPSKALSA